MTWDIARERGYTLMPKPYTPYGPELLRPPSLLTIALRAWRSRGEHPELLAPVPTAPATTPRPSPVQSLSSPAKRH